MKIAPDFPAELKRRSELKTELKIMKKIKSNNEQKLLRICGVFSPFNTLLFTLKIFCNLKRDIKRPS